jgi:hypothetical protein
MDRTSQGQQCPICRSDEATIQKGLRPTYVCPICGTFILENALSITPPREWADEPHPYLSAATRKASEAGDPLTISHDNWRRLEEEQRSIRVSQKLTDTLRLIAARSGSPGHLAEIKADRDYPLVAANDEPALREYIGHLCKRELVTESPYEASVYTLHADHCRVGGA